MAKDDKLEPTEELLDEEDLVSRRDFLVGLGKWSKIVIGLVLLGGTLTIPENDAAAQLLGQQNRGGGGWANGWWQVLGQPPGWRWLGSTAGVAVAGLTCANSSRGGSIVTLLRTEGRTSLKDSA